MLGVAQQFIVILESDLDELENGFKKEKYDEKDSDVTTTKIAKPAPNMKEVPARRADTTDPADSAPLATPNLEEAKGCIGEDHF
jgi:hypothetical protein